MFVLSDVSTIYFDVDDTLILYNRYDLPDENRLLLEVGANLMISVHPHEKHIAALIEHKKKGYNIVVWSQSGSEWAESVIKKLNLTKYVDVVLSKPYMYYDDLLSYQFMGEANRIYLD